MERYQEIPCEDGAGISEEDDRAATKEDAADKNISPQDTKVLPERESLDVLLVIRHLGFLGGRRNSLLVVLLGY